MCSFANAAASEYVPVFVFLITLCLVVCCLRGAQDYSAFDWLIATGHVLLPIIIKLELLTFISYGILAFEAVLLVLACRIQVQASLLFGSEKPLILEPGRAAALGRIYQVAQVLLFEV